MQKEFVRNPITHAFASGSVPRHQTHADKRRRDRRVKHKRPFYDGEE